MMSGSSVTGYCKVIIEVNVADMGEDDVGTPFDVRSHTWPSDMRQKRRPGTPTDKPCAKRTEQAKKHRSNIEADSSVQVKHEPHNLRARELTSKIYLTSNKVCEVTILKFSGN